MGTFGANNFDNDSAMDWVDEFNVRRSLSRIEATLSPQKSIEEFWQEQLVCCELVAALMGYPADELDPDLEEWADKQREKFRAKASTIVPLSQTTIQRIVRMNSEGENDEYLIAWRAHQDDLLSRLARPLLEKGATRIRRAPIVEVEGISEQGPTSIRLRLASIDVLDGATRRLQKVSEVSLNLAQDISESEHELLADWLAGHPECELFLTDYPRKRGVKLQDTQVVHYSRVRKLFLQCEGGLTSACLAPFRDLERLTLKFFPVPEIFPVLATLPRLQELKLLEISPKAMEKGFEHLTHCRELRNFEILFSGAIAWDAAGDLTVGISLSLPALPELPPQLHHLKCRRVAFGSMDALTRSRTLVEVECSSFKTETAELDLRSVVSLKGITFTDTRGLNRLFIPPHLRSLELMNVGGATVDIPSEMPDLKVLAVDRSALPVELPSFRKWKDLTFVWFRHWHHPADGAVLSDAPALQGLMLDLEGEGLPLLNGSHTLRYLYINGERIGDARLDFSLVADAPSIEEIELRSLSNEHPPICEHDLSIFKQTASLRCVNIATFISTSDDLDSYLVNELKLLPQSESSAEEWMQSLSREVNEEFRWDRELKRAQVSG